MTRIDPITLEIMRNAFQSIADEMTAKRGSSKRLEAAMTALDRLGVDVKQTIRQQVQASVQLSAADLIAALQDAERAGSSDGAE